jgi:thiamine biosynthesis lipoprotein
MTPTQSDRQVALTAGEDCLVGRFAAMASPCEVLLETSDRDDALRLARIVAAEAWRIEDKFSRYASGNIIEAINTANGNPVELDAETAQLIDFAATLYGLSSGSFDITCGVLRSVWRFDGSDNVPGRAAVEKIMQRVGWHRATWNPPLLRLQPGMEVDLGGIGKEYAVDRCAALLRDECDVGCLVNFGGDLAAVRPPHKRPAGWRVGIEALDVQRPAAERTLNLMVGGLATSGDARRFLLRDGIRYSHILDPRTGWPVPDAPRSVTVAADSCTQAGMLSTLAMLKGAHAEDFLREQGVQFWCNRGSETTAPNTAE